MRKLIVFFGLMALILLPQTQAFAEHSSGETFFTKKWPAGVNRNYCIEDFDGPLGSGEYTNMRQSVINAMNNEYEARTQMTTNFSLVGGQCADDYDYDSLYGDCFSIGNLNLTSRISYDNIDGGAIAEAFWCDTDANGNIDFFWVAIDPEHTGLDWHWAHDTNVPNNDVQFSGVFTQELGHGLGFTGGFLSNAHWSGTSNACPNDSSQQTMCSGNDWDGAVTPINGSCGCAFTTLGTGHDIPEFNEVYP